MGGEGSMMAANNSLKNNRSLLLKRREKGALTGSYSNVKLAEFPEATPEQLKEIKKNILKENRINRIKQIILFLMLFLTFVLIFFYLKH
ncbi:hypothetical protein Q4Q39_17060 [Flavivirga amylovorans]|uniref:Riboflavin synthase subunit beta n=1 Tax=Flavivirga amylovorans TaxID=870486 RepID=A0ABT8X571_9FLAO|nr:hypothetical protein [Flavivirga amylovorans]MDO5989117.1 hypothetical protein [Flavivirga amylovorans]